MQRRNAEALALLDEGQAVWVDGSRLEVRARMTRGLARCLSAGSGGAPTEEADLEEAARLAVRLGSDSLVGEVALRRGTCRGVRNDVVGAETGFREALGVARRRGLPSLEAYSAGSLGWLRVRAGQYDSATDWFHRSMEVSRGNKTLLAKNLVNLGWCYYKLGDFERAVSLLGRAESLAASRGLGGDRLVALVNLGNISYRRNDFAEATSRYRLGLALARDLGDRSVVAQLVANLATVALEVGKLDEAEVHNREALRLKEELGDESSRLYSLLVDARIWIARGSLPRAEAMLRQVLSSRHLAPDLAWEVRWALAEARVRAGRIQEAASEFRRAFGEMEKSRSALQVPEHRISFFSSLRRFHDAYVEFLVDQGRVGEALDVADRSRARLLAERLGRETVPLTGVEKDKRTARELAVVLLSYWTANRRSFLWVVTADNVELRTLPDEATLRRRVAAHLTRIQSSRDPLEEGARDGQWLYRTLIEPAEDVVPPGSRVLLVPDGPLHQLNFETLVVPGPKPHYWIEDVTLATAPSLGLLDAAASARKPEKPSILVIGDPVSPSEEFPPLPYAAREVAGIAGLFEPSRRTVRSGIEAEPSAYRAADPAGFDFIHFAAHATANRESPLDSAVVLSARDESYKLYAREIVTIPLRADLVTLSACRSAGSRAFAGEGLVGLAWAFLGSGARNVVGGLWNVEDASTAELMEHLYRGVGRGLDPVDALREAKLGLLRSGTAYRKPFYWAPFVVYTRGGA